MTDEIKITTVKKEKDPKRVMAGRRLAAIGQEARRTKKLLSESESKGGEKRENDKGSGSGYLGNINYNHVIGTSGLLLSVLGLYYTWKNAKETESRERNATETNQNTNREGKEEKPKEYKHVKIENDVPVRLDTLD